MMNLSPGGGFPQIAADRPHPVEDASRSASHAPPNPVQSHRDVEQALLGPAGGAAARQQQQQGQPPQLRSEADRQPVCQARIASQRRRRGGSCKGPVAVQDGRVRELGPRRQVPVRGSLPVCPRSSRAPVEVHQHCRRRRRCRPKARRVYRGKGAARAAGAPVEEVVVGDGRRDCASPLARRLTDRQHASAVSADAAEDGAACGAARQPDDERQQPAVEQRGAGALLLALLARVASLANQPHALQSASAPAVARADASLCADFGDEPRPSPRTAGDT